MLVVFSRERVIMNMKASPKAKAMNNNRDPMMNQGKSNTVTVNNNKVMKRKDNIYNLLNNRTEKQDVKWKWKHMDKRRGEICNLCGRPHPALLHLSFSFLTDLHYITLHTLPCCFCFLFVSLTFIYAYISLIYIYPIFILCIIATPTCIWIHGHGPPQ